MHHGHLCLRQSLKVITDSSLKLTWLMSNSKCKFRPICCYWLEYSRKKCIFKSHGIKFEYIIRLYLGLYSINEKPLLTRRIHESKLPDKEFPPYLLIVKLTCYQIISVFDKAQLGKGSYIKRTNKSNCSIKSRNCSIYNTPVSKKFMTISTPIGHHSRKNILSDYKNSWMLKCLEFNFFFSERKVSFNPSVS